MLSSHGVAGFERWPFQWELPDPPAPREAHLSEPRRLATTGLASSRRPRRLTGTRLARRPSGLACAFRPSPLPTGCGFPLAASSSVGVPPHAADAGVPRSRRPRRRLISSWHLDREELRIVLLNTKNTGTACYRVRGNPGSSFRSVRSSRGGRRSRGDGGPQPPLRDHPRPPGSPHTRELWRSRSCSTLAARPW